MAEHGVGGGVLGTLMINQARGKAMKPKIFASLVAMFSMIVSFAMPAQATVGPLVSNARVIVDGETFNLWGVWDESTSTCFMLRDMAYILNGTPAQFDIRKSDDDRFDYWIIRGVPYTPTGNEFRSIYIDCDYGVGWFGGGRYHAVVGVDGIDAPETAISLSVWGDEHDFYFPVGMLAQLLGFTVDWSLWGFGIAFHDYFIEDVDYVLSTGANSPAELPIQSIDLLELMAHLAGDWVDIEHFYSPIIDESVVWPVGLRFSEVGLGIHDADWPSWTDRWYPISMHNIAENRVELIAADTAVWAWNHLSSVVPSEDYLPHAYERRIVVETGQEQIDEIIYYIGDTRYLMVRVADSPRDARRYYAEPYEGGGIRLLYVIGPRRPSSGDFMVYRSSVYGERGTRVFLQEELGRYDGILFEFVDTTVESGNVYYYSLWRTGWSWSEHYLPITEQAWQMRVDADAVLGELEYVKTENPEGEEMEEIYTSAVEETLDGHLNVWLLMPLAAISFFVGYKYYNSTLRR